MTNDMGLFHARKLLGLILQIKERVNSHTIEISGQTSEELTPRKGTKSNRLRFDPYRLKFNPLNKRKFNLPAGIGLGLDRTPVNKTAMGGYQLSFLYRGSSPDIYSSSSASTGRICGSLRFFWANFHLFSFLLSACFFGKNKGYHSSILFNPHLVQS